FVENRIQMTMDSLSLFENETAQFMKNNNIISLSEQLKAEIEKAADMKAQIMAKEVELDIMKTRLTPNNQIIADSEIALKLLKDKYGEFFDHSSSDGLFLNLENIPNLQKKYARLQRKVVYFSKLLEYLGPQYEQAKIEEAKDVPTIQILDKATRPEWKDSPRRFKIIISAVFISFIFSIIVILLRLSIINYKKNMQ
ncbi:MAG: hypothetical protein H8D22_03910, partial [Candidatus Cloacimonetes bacterium]|nr:hypothetical protein [Candidatus Cloacimonadota bacterium]